MTNETRYHLLRPAEAVARRVACPIAYIPIGTLEWHGVHNPLGADTLQAERLSVLCAGCGGLAFPPLYYGESRTEGLMESNAADKDEIAAQMQLDPDNFTPEYFLFSEAEQTENYQRLLAHMLNQVETLGFEVAVILAGHYPLVDHARAAALLHNKRVRKSRGMLAWATSDYLHLLEQYACAGDHGGGWETSHCMAIDAGLVDLSLLPPKGEKIIGAGGRMDPRDADAAFGAKIFAEAAEIISREARHRLENKRLYQSHGRSLTEKLYESGHEI